MSLAGICTETPPAIFLQPRLLSRTPGRFVLLPLLPRPRPVKPLPAEVWSKVLSYVIDDGADSQIGVPEKRARLRKTWGLLFVLKPWVVSIVSFYAQQNRRVADFANHLFLLLELSYFLCSIPEFISSL